MSAASTKPPQFTVFTPTYNRAHTITRVYDSLVAQTYRDFEWIVIDDGSTDATKLLIKKWQDTARIFIRYYYQENSGKQRRVQSCGPNCPRRTFPTD